MSLLSWIAPAGRRDIVSLDLLSYTSMVSVPSPTHPSAQDDVGTIAAGLQCAERGGQPLVDMFDMLYGDGVERLAAQSKGGSIISGMCLNRLFCPDVS